jgi:hypothetical protein
MSDRPRLVQRVVPNPWAPLPVGFWLGLFVADGVIWSRWLVGALIRPIPPLVALGSSLIVATVSIVALIHWRESHQNRFAKIAWWPELLTLAVVTGWQIAVGLGTSPFTQGGLVGSWGLLIVATGLAHAWFPQGAWELASDGGMPMPLRNAAGPQSSLGNPQASSHWQKRLLIEGSEMIEGEACVDFLPGQREAVLHLSFCPPFATVPEVHGEDALGGNLEVRAEAVHTFGARLSVRRSSGIEAAESCQISYIAGPAGLNDAAA